MKHIHVRTHYVKRIIGITKINHKIIIFLLILLLRDKMYSGSIYPYWHDGDILTQKVKIFI